MSRVQQIYCTVLFTSASKQPDRLLFRSFISPDSSTADSALLRIQGSSARSLYESGICVQLFVWPEMTASSPLLYLAGLRGLRIYSNETIGAEMISTAAGMLRLPIQLHFKYLVQLAFRKLNSPTFVLCVVGGPYTPTLRTRDPVPVNLASSPRCLNSGVLCSSGKCSCRSREDSVNL